VESSGKTPVGSLWTVIRGSSVFVHENMNFYERSSIASYASSGIAIAEMSVRLYMSVRLFVCPSHSGIVSKRTKLAS